MAKRHYLGLLFGLLFYSGIHAQSLSGKIKEATSKDPIPYATVVLKDLNGDFLEGTTSDDKGKYRLAYKEGKYILSITFMGYENINREIELKGDMVLHFDLKSSATELGEIVVTAERTTVEQLIDKKVINVGQDLLSAGGDAATILSQIAEIDADIDGNISLRGSNNVTILVNGKPSALGNAELLQQLSSNEINKVEIITSPSAKYQASGLTGIINIITDKKVQKGLSISSNFSVNSLGSYNPRIGLQYGHSKMNFKLGGSYSSRISKNNNTQSRVGLAPYTQYSDYDFEGEVFAMNGGIDWFLSENDEFSFSIDYRDNGHDMVNEATIIQNNESNDQETYISHSHKTLNSNANYRRYFNDKSGYIELDAQISDNANILQSDFRPNQEVLDNYTNNDVLISNVALDFSNEWTDDLKLESGLFWNRQKLNNNRNRSRIGNDPTIDQFENEQSTYAAYMLLKYKIKALTLQAGLRGESYRRYAQLLTEQSEINNEFNDIFPSFHMSYNIKEAHTLTLGYNRRTSRPRLSQVNPNPYQGRAFSINRGNPALQPEFSNNIDLSYQYQQERFKITPSISYRIKNQTITRYQFVNEENLTEGTYINNGNSDAWGIELNTSLSFPQWLKTDLSYNWYYEKFRAAQTGFTRDYARSSNFTLKNQFTFSKKASMALTWRYAFDRIAFNSTNEVNQNLDIAFRYKILNKNGNINLRITDIFNTRRWDTTITGEGFIYGYQFKPLSRMVHLSFSYTLKGNDLKKRNKKKRKYGSGVMH